MHLDKHLKVLVQQNTRFVAMCEEFPRVSTSGAKEGFDRRVVRVITPGTLIDEPFLNPYENNYLLAITDSQHFDDPPEPSRKPVGLAWIDVSTGEFFSHGSTYENLRDELARIAPRETVLDKSLESNPSHPIRQAVIEEGSFISYTTPSATVSQVDISDLDYSDDLTVPDEMTPSSSLPTFSPQEASAVKLLTTFLHANLLDHMPRLSSPNREAIEGRMHIDSHTIKALEIRESITGGGLRGSLLSVVKRTVTSGGTRLLSRWLCEPFNNYSKFMQLTVSLQAPQALQLKKSTLASRSLLSCILGLTCEMICWRHWQTSRI